MAKTLAIIFGIIFVLVGLLGFVPNPIVGMGAIFDTNHLHDGVHILFGLILLGVGFMAPMKSALWLKILGVVYILLAVLGFLLVPNGGDLLGLVTTNMADHLLHVVLGVVLLVAGFATKAGAKAAPAAMPAASAPAPAMPSSMPPSNPPSGGSM